MILTEKSLFETLQKKIPDLTFAEHKVSRWDCVSHERQAIIELKSRRTHYPTLLIEKKKYDALIDKANEVGYKAVYINSTPKGIYCWVLNEMDIEWNIETKYPATTSFGNTKRVPKEVGYLCITQSKIIKEFK